ncbi:tetratricopeptide repeat protein [Candidatus Dependentiae bacterium]|nr:tetratricopeptide repeat protein [Candidatus Dependentiae bacterium]
MLKNIFENKIISCLLLVCISFTVFSPSLQSGFINLDDKNYLINNDYVKKLSFTNIKKIFTTYHEGAYKPLVFFTFSIERHFFGLTPFVYRINNLIIHIINIILVFMLFRLQIKDDIISPFFIALLFGIHPIKTESVIWITERKDMLFGIFFLSASISYIKFSINKSTANYILSILFLTISLLAKPQAITFPFILILYDYLTEQILLKNIINKIPFIIICLIFIIFNIFQNNSVNSQFIFNSFSDSIFIGVFNILFYISKLIFPYKISFIYPEPKLLFSQFSFYDNLHFYSVLLSFTFIIFYLTKKNKTRIIIAGLCFFIISIFPTLHIITIGKVATANRYNYIPSIGIFFILIYFIKTVISEQKLHKNIKNYILLFIVIIISFYAASTYFLNLNWNNSDSIFTDAIQKYKKNPFAFLCRAGNYYDLKKYDNALSDCIKTLKMSPEDYDALRLRGKIYISLNNFDKAFDDLSEVIKKYYDPDIYNSMGIIYYSTANYDTAAQLYSVAISLEPNNSKFIYNRALSYFNMKKFNDAELDFKKILKINDSFFISYYYLGLIKFLTKNYLEAELFFTQSLNLNSNIILSYYYRALCNYNLNQYEKAKSDSDYLLSKYPKNTEFIKLKKIVYGK